MYNLCLFRIKKSDKVYWTACSLSVYCCRDEILKKYHYAVIANCYSGDTELLFTSLESADAAYRLVDEVCRKYPDIDSDYIDYEQLPLFEHPLYIQNF